MAATIRALTAQDSPVVLDFLNRDPITHIFLLSRVYAGALTLPGSPLWGCWDGVQLVSVCHTGTNLVVAGHHSDALDLFVELVGSRRYCSFIMGEARVTSDFYERLCHGYGSVWDRPREIRSYQPIMAMTAESAFPANPRVRVMDHRDLDAYFRAAVAMYTEELGVSPLDRSGGYRQYVISLIRQSKAFGILEADQVIFKTDLGVSIPGVCQLQGVWVHPDYRRHGIGAGAIAAVTNHCLSQYGTVSLYVNDFNEAALATYRKVGFQQVGAMATILY